LETEAIQLVEGALRDPDSLVRQTAAAELGQMKAREAIPSLQNGYGRCRGRSRVRRCQSAWDMGDRSGRDLTSSGRDGFQRKHLALCWGLAQDCDAESLRLLEWSATSDKSWAVKAASAKALGQCGNPDAIPMLDQNLADSNAAVKSMSAGAIIKLSRKPLAHAPSVPRSRSCERLEPNY